MLAITAGNTGASLHRASMSCLPRRQGRIKDEGERRCSLTATGQTVENKSIEYLAAASTPLSMSRLARHLVAAQDPILQPTEERRRTGAIYAAQPDGPDRAHALEPGIRAASPTPRRNRCSISRSAIRPWVGRSLWRHAAPLPPDSFMAWAAGGDASDGSGDEEEDVMRAALLPRAFTALPNRARSIWHGSRFGSRRWPRT